MNVMTPSELAQRLNDGESFQLLDVREPWECDTASIDGTINIPMNSIPNRLAELDPEKPTVVICHHGMRSAQVAMYLQSQSFDHVINLTGGIDLWSHDVDSTVPRY